MSAALAPCPTSAIVAAAIGQAEFIARAARA